MNLLKDTILEVLVIHAPGGVNKSFTEKSTKLSADNSTILVHGGMMISL